MRTKAEIAIWRAKMKSLARDVGAMPKEKQSELADKYGTVTPEGHRLSTYNTCFLISQAGARFPLAQVGGFRQWKAAGRAVRAGEHACGCIYIPLGCRRKAGELTEDEPTGFALVSVFDVTQTEPTGAALTVENSEAARANAREAGELSLGAFTDAFRAKRERAVAAS